MVQVFAGTNQHLCCPVEIGDWLLNFPAYEAPDGNNQLSTA